MNQFVSTPASSDMQSPAAMRGVLTQGLVALAASLIVVDTPLNREEYSAFRILFPMHSRRDLRVRQWLQDGMHRPVAPTQAANMLAPLFINDTTLREEVLARFVALAWADASIHPTEHEWLMVFTAALGLAPEVLEDLLQQIAPYTHERDPYRILGVAPEASVAEIKRAWQQQLRLFHPDAVVAQGVSDAEQGTFGQRMTEINVAYDKILKLRGVRG